MQHTCQALLVHCIDFRLQEGIKKYLSEQDLLGDCDVVAVAGGAKNLDFIISQIDISKKLHSIKQVILMNHTDCGAYGGDDSRHEADLKKAQDAILAKYPELMVETILRKLP